MHVRFIKSQRRILPDCFLAERGPRSRTLVVIHGISRNAAEIAARFAGDQRFDNFTICAPLFEKSRFGRYQQLTVGNNSVPSGKGLLRLLASLEEQVGVDVAKIDLFGFSGGAQMAHRFAMLHPDRVERVVAASAGWYLMPDPALPYPYGLAGAPNTVALECDFLRIPITVAVGSCDSRIDSSVRQEEPINRIQGKSRIERANAWVEAMRKLANDRGLEPRTRLFHMKNGTHDFGQCARHAGLIDLAAEAFS